VLIAKEDRVTPPFVEDKFLKIEIPFDRTIYERTEKKDLPQFFSTLYMLGFNNAKDMPMFPYVLLKDALQEFRDNGYRNEWQARSKNLREIGVTAVLKCSMTIDFFSLILEIRKKGQILFQEEILRTLPDEIFFSGEFENIIYDNRQISVVNKFKGRIFYIDWPISSN
jgi:hypothetical protein